MIYFFILTSNRWKLNLAYQMLSLPHLHSISTSWTFDWPFNFLPFCINCAFRQLFLNIILTIVNHLLFQNQFQIPLQTISSPLLITTVLSYHIERLPKMWAALLAPSLPVKKGALRVTTLQRSNFPLKRKKEREGESLALLQIWYSILGYLLGLIDLDKQIAL